MNCGFSISKCITTSKSHRLFPVTKYKLELDSLSNTFTPTNDAKIDKYSGNNKIKTIRRFKTNILTQLLVFNYVISMDYSNLMEKWSIGEISWIAFDVVFESNPTSFRFVNNSLLCKMEIVVFTLGLIV